MENHFFITWCLFAENDNLIDSATIWPYSVRQLRMNVYNNDGNDVDILCYCDAIEYIVNTTFF